jgi:hypothetical protein
VREVVAEPQFGLEVNDTDPFCFLTVMVKLTAPLLVKVRVVGDT